MIAEHKGFVYKSILGTCPCMLAHQKTYLFFINVSLNAPGHSGKFVFMRSLITASNIEK